VSILAPNTGTYSLHGQVQLLLPNSLSSEIACWITNSCLQKRNQKHNSNTFLNLFHHQSRPLTSPVNRRESKGGVGHGRSLLAHLLQFCIILCSSYTAGFWKFSHPRSIFLLTGLLLDILLRDWSHPLPSSVMVNFISIPPPKSPWEV